MKITVLGATGGVGQQVVQQALADGDQVTAVVRDPTRLPLPAHPALDVVRADVVDHTQLGPLIAGRDAVISALGTHGRKPTSLCTDAARALVTAAGEVGVRRILVVSASGAFSEKNDDRVTRWVAKPILQRILRENFADLAGMESEVRASGLDWTIVRPPRLLDKPHTGNYRTGFDGIHGGSQIARADVADALLAFVARADLVGRTVSVAR